MTALRKQSIFLALVVICFGGGTYAKDPATDSEPKAKPKTEKKARRFIRVRRDADGKPQAMETAVASYQAIGKENAGLIVDLVGVVHVGDKSYYEKLNKAFESYDAVLYELIAPEGTRIPKGGRKTASGHPITILQQGMKNFLELDYQLDHIDYTKKNFVHADMTPDEFAKSMKDRNESFLKMFFRMLGQSAAMQARGKGASDAALFAAIFAKDRALKLKQIMAQQFEDMTLWSWDSTVRMDRRSSPNVTRKRSRFSDARSRMGRNASPCFTAQDTCRTWTNGLWKTLD